MTKPERVFRPSRRMSTLSEIYSILTEEGVITPTRVLMGGTNSVAYVQSTVQEMFAELFNNGLLIWIDDLLGWAIVEKEAYAIIETCRRADYLLHRPDGFALFTDHRNLRYIFDPHSVSTAVPKYTADKLHRWSLLLMAYKYEIYDISGDDNVWADLLSRWGSSFKTMRKGGYGFPMRLRRCKYECVSSATSVSQAIVDLRATNQEYVLVIKDDASKFAWLLPCEAADAETTYNALIDWFASFGFDIGDYVLYADVWQHTRTQVTATISNWIFEIQNLITGQRKEAHASRLKFYADESLEVNEELLMHVAHNSEGHVVDTLLKARYNPSAKRHEIKVHWRGLDTVEDSWEPADVLLQDVPTAVKAFVRKHNKQQPVKALRKALHLN
eukprot:jgi/Phyca11/16446/fgenesh1_pg.PHYCAscaffold_20_\